MKLIKAPNNDRIIREMFSAQARVFVAGGISNCPDWQEEFTDKFTEYGDHLVMYNPRRNDFDITNPNMSSEQIEWEYGRIDESNHMVFWFPEETLCPITLFELGVASQNCHVLYVGCHPNYARKFDVVKQLSLSRPYVKVVFSLDELAQQLKDSLDIY